MSVPVKSLSTPAEASVYFSSRLYCEDWASATADNQQKALNDATLIINRFRYLGFKTDPNQLNEFPRNKICGYPDNIIPDEVLNAQYEFALGLIRGFDLEREKRGVAVTSRGFASVRTTYDSNSIPEFLALGLPSSLGWDYLSPFIDKDPGGVIKIHRVS